MLEIFCGLHYGCGRSAFGCSSCAVPRFPFQIDEEEFKMFANIYKDCRENLGWLCKSKVKPNLTHKKVTHKLLFCTDLQIMSFFCVCQIVFEGIRGTSYQGDIAIDDIALTVGACVVLPHNAVPTLPPTTPISTATPTAPPKGKFDCDFEIDFCSWTQDSSDTFNWTRHHGRTSSTATGPTTDHTLKTGTFQISPHNHPCAYSMAYLVHLCTEHWVKWTGLEPCLGSLCCLLE